MQNAISFDDNGNTVYNSSIRELLINPLDSTNDNDMPLLGMTFLQAAYLHVNYDENNFILWQANPTSDEKLVGVGASSIGCPNSTSSSTGSKPSSRAATQSSLSSQSNSSGSKTRAIAISVTLVIVAALLLTGFGFWRLRARRRRLASSRNPRNELAAYRDQRDMFEKPELDSTEQRLPSSQKLNRDLAKSVPVELQELPAFPATPRIGG